MIIERDVMVDTILKLLTDKQAWFVKGYVKNNKSRMNTAKDLNVDVGTIDRFRSSKTVRTAVELIEKLLEVKEEEKERATIEWTIDKYMDYLKKAETELAETEKEISNRLAIESKSDNDIKLIELLSDRRDKLEKDIQSYLKLITDHQNKFGEIIDRKAAQFKAPDIKSLVEQGNKLVERFNNAVKSFGWHLER